jgi:hypothetical protein
MDQSFLADWEIFTLMYIVQAKFIWLAPGSINAREAENLLVAIREQLIALMNVDQASIGYIEVVVFRIHFRCTKEW